MIPATPATKPGDLYGRPWNRREYIIALHHYFVHRPVCPDKGSRVIYDIAETLGRTPAAVAMRLHNFASIDPDGKKERSGLQNIGPVGRELFSYWHSRVDALHEVAKEFEREANEANVHDLFNPDPVQMPLAFGRYEPMDAIGNGGFGTVVSCLDPESGNNYAIKIIRSDLVDDPEALSRFRREINLLKCVRHPHVIAIHDDNLDSERHYPAYVMDLGEWSLRCYLDRNRTGDTVPVERPLLPRAEGVEVILQVMEGVEALHTNSPPVVHRDIKPENILKLANDNWVIADFGLAKYLPPVSVSNSFATASKKAMGSSGYAAPEQFMDFRSADQRADIYSLGVLIWEMFSPAWGTMDRADTELPSPLERVVLKATNKKPENRHHSISELRDDFVLALDEF